jgi:hypothetical protein
MNRSVLALVFAASIVIPPTPATATVTVFDATLTGAEEVPPVATTGTGFATITIDDTLFTMRVQGSFSGLVSTTTAGVIHCCAAVGANSGVATPTPAFAGFPLGVTAGTYDNTLDMTLGSSYNPAFLTANGGTPASAFAALFSGMLAGDSYLNIHTVMFPGGEIRGQLEAVPAAVPEASTWAMMLLGCGAMGFALRRGRKSASRGSVSRCSGGAISNSPNQR